MIRAAMIFSTLLLAGCSTSIERPVEALDHQIELQAFRLSSEINTVKYTRSPELPSLQEPPLAPIPITPFMCGGVYSSDHGWRVRQILDNSAVVADLNGVVEEWIPINGKPKKYYFF